MAVTAAMIVFPAWGECVSACVTIGGMKCDCQLHTHGYQLSWRPAYSWL